MTDVLDRPAEEAAEPQIRDRADVRRQIKLVVVLGLVLLAELWFTLSIDDPTVQHLLKGKRTIENQPVVFEGGPISWAAVVIAAAALLAAILNRTQSGRQRPIRIIADDGDDSQAQ